MSGLLTRLQAGGEEGTAPPGRRPAVGGWWLGGWGWVGGESHGVAPYIQMLKGEWTHLTAAQIWKRC